MEERTVSKVKTIELPSEQKSKMMGESMQVWWLTAVTSFMKTVGPEKALEVLGPAMYQLGKDDAVKMASTLKLEARDAPSLASVVEMFEGAMGIQGEIIQVEDERVAKVNKSCPLSKCPPEVCQVIECYGRGMTTGLAPEYTFVQDETLTKGDPHCRWEIRKK